MTTEHESTEQAPRRFVQEQSFRTRKQEFAQEFRVPAEKIRNIRVQLHELRRRGIFVQVKVTGIGRLRTSASHLELGIASGDQRQIRITPGKKALIPEHYMNQFLSVDAKIRKALWQHAQVIEPVRSYRYMRPHSFFTWKETHDTHAQELEDLKEKVVQNWAVICDEMEQTWTQVAEEAWVSFQARTDDTAQKILEAGRDSFVSEIVNQMLRAMPTLDQIREIEATWWSALVEDDRDIEMAASEALDKRLTRQEREQIALMRQQEILAANEHMMRTNSPVMQVMRHLEERVYNEVMELLEAVQKKGVIHPRQVKQLESLRTMYQMSSVRDNTELVRAFDALSETLDIRVQPPEEEGAEQSKQRAPKRDPEAIAEALKRITEAVMPEARHDSDSLIGALEV